MTLFCDLNAVSCSLLKILMLGAACLQVTGIIAGYLWIRRPRHVIPLILLFLMDFPLLVIMDNLAIADLRVQNFILRLPSLYLFLFIFLSWALTLVVIFHFRNMYHHEITPVSIKEGLDTLPLGICFYMENGIPLLVNSKMNDLADCISLHGLQNAKQFLQELEVLSPGPHPLLVQVSSGRTYSFDTKEILVNKKPVHELLAIDVTEYQELTRKLEAENAELDHLNQRLQSYNMNAIQAQKEEEVLAAKIRIHDELGNAIVTSRIHIRHRVKDMDWDELNAVWKRCIALFHNERIIETPEHGFAELKEAGKSVGIEVFFLGDLDAERSQPVERIIINAGRECLTNAVRHAGASKLFITLQKEKEEMHVTISNDGRPPAAPIKEGGGLSGLRQRIESHGGRMTVTSMPQFKLQLWLPERKKEQ